MYGGNMKKFILFHSAILAGALFSFSGCASTMYSKYERPDDIKADSLFRDTASTNALNADSGSFASMSWKEMFTDPALQALIEKGLKNNADMQIATARLNQYKAKLTAADLAFLPSLSLSASGDIEKTKHGTTKTYKVPLSASWEVDLFGSALNEDREAAANLLKSKAYGQTVRTELNANIALDYLQLLTLDEQKKISEETDSIWEENITTTEAMKDAGSATEADVLESKANADANKMNIASLEREIREMENSLSILLGEAPGIIPRSTLAGQNLPVKFNAGVPLELLSHRPDVLEAEMELAASYYRTNQARSAFYPKVTINASAAWTNQLGNVIENPGSYLFSLLGEVSQPIFNRGELTSNLKVSKEAEKIAKINYKQTILQAGKEVSDALYSYQTATTTKEMRTGQIETLTQALDASESLFESGSCTHLQVLTSRENLLNAKLSAVSDSYDQAAAVIKLYKALGGGTEAEK